MILVLGGSQRSAEEIPRLTLFKNFTNGAHQAAAR